MPTYGLNQPAPKKPFATPAATGAQAVAKSNGGPIQSPGNNLVNPGYGEQAFEYSQNRLLDDPYAGQTAGLVQTAKQAGGAEEKLYDSLGSLSGPGQGDQHWNQVQGQYMDPFAGEQFARDATQNFAGQGPASAFYGQAMGQYDDFTGYSGPQNAQGQYGQSSQSLAGGTQGEQGLGQIAGQYGSIGQYGDPNLAAGQYAQTQGAFGDMPIANFDPFYDRARQLATQDYNRQSAGRGVYGSSEALSGVGNVITDIEAQRANRSFDAEMQRTQEQRARQQLLGEQARMGDLSSLAAFGANLSGAETFGNINNQLATQELGRNELLGNMANNADTQALGAQNANIAGVQAFGNIANNADTAETDRYEASTTAMNNADRTGLDRMNSGVTNALAVDTGNRQDFDSETAAATNAANIRNNRLQTASNIADTGSDNDLARLDSFNSTAQGAENQRQARQVFQLEAVKNMSKQLQDLIGKGLEGVIGGSQEDFENWFNSEIAPALQKEGKSEQEANATRQQIGQALGFGAQVYASNANKQTTAAPSRKLDPNPY
jgi:hypothetical protein